MAIENSLILKIEDLKKRLTQIKDYIEFDQKQESLEEINLELSSTDIWNDQERAQQVNKQKSSLEKLLLPIEQANIIQGSIVDLLELIELDPIDSSDAETILFSEIDQLEAILNQLEFRKMFSGQMDHTACYLDLQSGSGGTEAQDWVEMLLRMYSKWLGNKGFDFELIDSSNGDVAGLKNATLKISTPYAYGWLRTETGIHRLVRKSPFDTNNKRHTSFASVYVYPEIDDNIEIKIDPSDLRIDLFRASGAGGQHVNKTESAVRITHIPTNIVVQSQSSRSQHQNKDECIKQLRARLYELELNKQKSIQQVLEDNKSDIGWGSQIRSYVLDDSRVKDLRTNVESRTPQAVLDGGLDEFIETSLKYGL